MEVTAAASVKMQGVSVTGGTGPAFRATGAKSRLHLVSCSGTVAPLADTPSHSGSHSEIESSRDQNGETRDGSRDSARVYVRSGGGQIRAVDCKPEMDPKPKVCVRYMPHQLFALLVPAYLCRSSRAPTRTADWYLARCSSYSRFRAGLQFPTD